LKVSYHELYSVCNDPDTNIAELEEDGVWMVFFRRSLDPGQMEMGCEITDECYNFGGE
jgi:hypothetical protein